ncbi:MAG: ATP12 family protein [Pseudomonadota bacterium]
MADEKSSSEPRIPGKEAMQPELRKRFYELVSTQASDKGFVVTLDGRSIRTPGKAQLVLPSSELAGELAKEWERQADFIDPATMIMTKMANTAIDGIQGQEAAVRSELVKFAGNDLLCYRADHPQELVQRQKTAWDPILAWVHTTYAAEFAQTAGIMPVTQSETALNAIDRAFAGEDALSLSAMHVLITLSGSALLGLAVRVGHLTPKEAWDLAHVDEDWQIAQWGEDAEAQERREKRWSEFSAAARFLELLT